MPTFSELLNNTTLAAVIRLALVTFAFAGGIVGTIVSQNVNSTLEKVTNTEREIIVLTETTTQAKAEALAATTAVNTAKAESNRRFDDLERGLKDRDLELHEDTLKIYKLEVRIGCLEHKVVCP